MERNQDFLVLVFTNSLVVINFVMCDYVVLGIRFLVNVEEIDPVLKLLVNQNSEEGTPLKVYIVSNHISANQPSMSRASIEYA